MRAELKGDKKKLASIQVNFVFFKPKIGRFVTFIFHFFLENFLIFDFFSLQAKLRELDSAVIVVTKSDRQGRVRPDKKSEKDSDITALLRDEKNDDGGFASDAALMKAASKVHIFCAIFFAHFYTNCFDQFLGNIYCSLL